MLIVLFLDGILIVGPKASIIVQLLTSPPFPDYIMPKLFVSGRNYDILASIIAHLLMPLPFSDLSQLVRL